MEAVEDPKSLLRRALNSLTSRDFSASQKLAARAVQYSDPAIAAEARGLLAVAEILLAGHPPDHYAVLRISRADSVDSELVWSRFVELAETLAKPEVDSVPFAQEAYDLIYDAFSILTDPEKKIKYDAAAGRNSPPPPAPPPPAPASFWTVCPYCFWLFQYGKEYEECCLRCQNCLRAFHGVSIGEPPAEVVVPGSDKYSVCYGVFPLAYRAKENVGDKDSREETDKANNGSFEGRNRSDEGEDSGGRNWKKRAPKALARRIKNVKSVAKKRVTRECEPIEIDSDSDNENEKEINGELVFFEGDDDTLYVGLEDINVI